MDDLLWDPVMRIRGLWYDGLLDPMPQDRPPNPLFGQALVLGGQQLYGGTSAVEQLFFTTYKYDHVSTFKGAYHINPDYSHWYGWSRVMQDRDLVKGEESRLRRLAMSDPGFTVPAKPVVGEPVAFDASRLAAWGDASANTYEWWLGDGASSMPATSPVVQHIYAAAGTYTVQLNCSDSDLVNDVANPTTCSAKRTTSRVLVVKNAASLRLAPVKPVKAGATVSVKGTLTVGAPVQDVLVTLWKRSGGGRWTIAVSRTVTKDAGASSLTFKRTLTRTTSFKITFAGDAQTWDATSNVRTVRPL